MCDLVAKFPDRIQQASMGPKAGRAALTAWNRAISRQVPPIPAVSLKEGGHQRHAAGRRRAANPSGEMAGQSTSRIRVPGCRRSLSRLGYLSLVRVPSSIATDRRRARSRALLGMCRCDCWDQSNSAESVLSAGASNFTRTRCCSLATSSV